MNIELEELVQFSSVYVFVIREIFKLNLTFFPKVSINLIQINKNIQKSFFEQHIVY